MADADTELAARLEKAISALRALAATQRSDDARTIEERAEAVRVAGCSFEELLLEQCVSYTSVFNYQDGEGWYEDDDLDDDDEDEDGPGRSVLPPGTRISVRIREDFVLVDEQAFRESAERVFAAKGPWPPEVDPVDPATAWLAALVDQVGLHEITFGSSVAGLRNAGGETEVLVVDQALQEDPDCDEGAGPPLLVTPRRMLGVLTSTTRGGPCE